MAHRNPATSKNRAAGNTRKDPEEWTTGDEPMTGAQHSYLKTLCDEAGEPMDATLTKAQAAQRINELQQKTGRGVGTHPHTVPRPANQEAPDAGTSGNARKDPEEWITGGEPMTAAQHSYLKTLSDEAGETMDETLTKAQASERIEELQRKTGRGTAVQEHQC